MIPVSNNTTTLNGPGASTGQSARVREAGVNDPSTASPVEASAVVSLSPQAASLAASDSQAQARPAAASTVQPPANTPSRVKSRASSSDATSGSDTTCATGPGSDVAEKMTGETPPTCAVTRGEPATGPSDH